MIGHVFNMQEALCRMALHKPETTGTYMASYSCPMDRVVFHPQVNPMVSLLEGLWVVSGRPTQEGFASYGPDLYRAKLGEKIDLEGRHLSFTTEVRDGTLDVGLHVDSVPDVYQFSADGICFSMVQEKLAFQHGLGVGKFFHICDDISAVDARNVSGNPYNSSEALSSKFWTTNMERHLGMFLDEGMVLGVRDPFLGRIANPVVQGLQAFLSKTEDRLDRAMSSITTAPGDNDWALASAAFLDHHKRTGQ